MKSWLLMFRPDTYEVVKERGVVGVLHQHRKRFVEISTGDRFVAYISRKRVIDGHGQFTDDPYQDVSKIWSTRERYPERCPVSFQQTGAEVDARDLLWHLSCWPEPMKTSPSNYLFCKGGFLEISDADHDMLVSVLNGAEPPGNVRPVARP